MTHTAQDIGNRIVNIARQRFLTTVALVGFDSAIAAAITAEGLRAWCMSLNELRVAPRHYDLLVCRGAFETLAHDEVEQAIADICKTVDLAIVDSTRTLGAAFARNGFVRAQPIDLPFLSRHATSYQRNNHTPLSEIVTNYEVALNQANLKIDELVIYRQQWEELQRSPGWRVLTVLQHARAAVLPPHSRREKLFARLSRHASAIPQNQTPPAEKPIAKEHDPHADYHAWFVNHAPSADQLQVQRDVSSTWTNAPLISVLMPVCDPPLFALEAAIESVVAQTNPHWELVCANGGSNAEARQMLDAFVARDARIRVQHLAYNEGISGNSNAALDMARGEFVALLDHDDLLAPNTLYEVAALLVNQPDTDIVYFDEDKVSADGHQHRMAWFKPTRYSPELMLSANVLMHSVVRRQLILDAGKFDAAYDGAQDWDLLLRCSERTMPDKIRHIARVLYHWRQLPSSAASTGLAAKSWVIELQPKTVAAHLTRLGLPDVSAHLYAPGEFQFTWSAPRPRVSIIIPTKDKLPLLKTCLQTLIEKTNYADYEIILVDTGSVEPATQEFYATWRAAHSQIRIVSFVREPFNYSAANNEGARHATGELLLFLNNDTEVIEPDWLSEMSRWALRREIGAVGAKLLYPDGTIQHAGVVIGMQGHLFAGQPERYRDSLYGAENWYRNFSAVTGACLMLRRAVFDEIGGFDERLQILYGDVALCHAITQHDYRILYTPYARLRHHEGASRANYVPPEDFAAVESSLSEVLRAPDPYYNPNLTLTSRVPQYK
jgi:GT2 family glycosyltransferase